MHNGVRTSKSFKYFSTLHICFKKAAYRGSLASTNPEFEKKYCLSVMEVHVTKKKTLVDFKRLKSL